MSVPTVFEVDENVLEFVVGALNYSSLHAFNDDVKKIKQWMQEEAQLPEIMDEKRIQNFLILNKGDVEKSKERISNYYTMRKRVPKIFDGINPKLPYIDNTLDAIYLTPMPKLTKDKYRVYICATRDKILMKDFHPVDGIRGAINLQEIRMFEDVTYGDFFILDGKDMPLNLVLRMTPSLMKNAVVDVYQNIFSLRLKGLYIINAPRFVSIVLMVLKLLLKPKLYRRIHIVQDPKTLIEQFGKDVIPRDYGGEGRSLDEIQSAARQKLKDYEEFFDSRDQL